MKVSAPPATSSSLSEGGPATPTPTPAALRQRQQQQQQYGVVGGGRPVYRLSTTAPAAPIGVLVCASVCLRVLCCAYMLVCACVLVCLCACVCFHVVRVYVLLFDLLPPQIIRALFVVRYWMFVCSCAFVCVCAHLFSCVCAAHAESVEASAASVASALQEQLLALAGAAYSLTQHITSSRTQLTRRITGYLTHSAPLTILHEQQQHAQHYTQRNAHSTPLLNVFSHLRICCLASPHAAVQRSASKVQLNGCSCNRLW
jgi:hypothetical protein